MDSLIELSVRPVFESAKEICDIAIVVVAVAGVVADFAGRGGRYARRCIHVHGAFHGVKGVFVVTIRV